MIQHPAITRIEETGYPYRYRDRDEEEDFDEDLAYEEARERELFGQEV
ncbi:MAG: hypothetical protein IJB91_03715 [Oscillospiraceae bacterium]|nr:hypothetical protein [Oscillospiraceae bacterium]